MYIIAIHQPDLPETSSANTPGRTDSNSLVLEMTSHKGRETLARLWQSRGVAEVLSLGTSLGQTCTGGGHTDGISGRKISYVGSLSTDQTETTQNL